MTIEKIIENLKGLEVNEYFEENVICAFEDYECEGETDVIVSESSVGYQAYVDHKDSPVILIEVENGIVIDAWEV